MPAETPSSDALKQRSVEGGTLSGENRERSRRARPTSLGRVRSSLRECGSSGNRAHHTVDRLVETNSTRQRRLAAKAVPCDLCNGRI